MSCSRDPGCDPTGALAPEKREVRLWLPLVPVKDVESAGKSTEESVGKSTEEDENAVGSTEAACTESGEVTALQVAGRTPPSKTGPTSYWWW